MKVKADVLFVQGAGAGAHDADAALVISLERALGDDYAVHFPRMPGEEDPDAAAWKRKMAAELSRLDGEIVLVGHSLGGSMLLKYVSDGQVGKPIAGLFLLAAPAWDGDKWKFDDLRLPPDIAHRLAFIPRIHLYHSRDDAVVPFAHLAIHGAALPQATIRAMEGRGHQFGNDLADIARDIRDSFTRATSRHG